MSINTDEVNFLVYRYLEESGFHHSAYVFGYESSVINAGIDSTLVPRGALMSLIQKSVLFAEAEVFSLLAENEIDAKFEKAIGSMSLLECTMTDAAKMRAFEKMRDDMSRVCSPSISISMSSAITTTASILTSNTTTKTLTTSDNTVINNDGLSCLTNTTSTSSLPQICPAIASSSTLLDTNTVSINTLPSHFQTKNNGSNLNDSEHNQHYSTSSNLNSLPTISMSGNDLNSETLSAAAQMQRDREFRAQQSQPLQQPSGALSGPPLRTSYRTSTIINDHKNLNATPHAFSPNTTNAAIHHQYFQQPSSQALRHPSTTSNTTETTSSFNSSANKISAVFTPTLLHHHQQSKNAVIENSVGSDFIPSKTANLKSSNSSTHLQQNQPNFLTNGSYSTSHGGKKAVTLASAASTSAISGTVMPSLSTTAPVSGSVFDNTRFYFKES